MIKEFLKATTPAPTIFGFATRPRLVCKDGFSVSVQASGDHYCHPRAILSDGEYESVELGYPSAAAPLLMEYAEKPSAPKNTVYGFVPVHIVDELIAAHGGIV